MTLPRVYTQTARCWQGGKSGPNGSLQRLGFQRWTATRLHLQAHSVQRTSRVIWRRSRGGHGRRRISRWKETSRNCKFSPPRWQPDINQFRPHRCDERADPLLSGDRLQWLRYQRQHASHRGAAAAAGSEYRHHRGRGDPELARLGQRLALARGSRLGTACQRQWRIPRHLAADAGP